MQVRVKSLQGDEYLIKVQNDHTVHQLKASISEKANGLPVDRQKLVYKGRTMQDTCLVSDYNLEEECKVHLIVQKGQESSSSAAQEGSSPKEADTGVFNEASATSPSDTNQSVSSQCPMEVSPTNLRNNEEMIRMLGQWGSGVGVGSSEQKVNDDGRDNNNSRESTSNNNSNHRPQSRFEVILRERLAAHFPSGSIDRIMENLYQEIDADINSSSLDDLERLAKQKLNITNE